jgi:hypothetical protein
MTQSTFRDLYQQQRYERLDEAIFDYTSDDMTSIEDLLADIRTILTENRAYYRKHVDRHNQALDGVDGLLPKDE